MLPCRAKFSYLPRRPKELRVDAGNVFHVLDDSPMMKGTFRVSRLSNDGTDAEQGIVPNSYRAQRYICEQGQGEMGGAGGEQWWGKRGTEVGQEGNRGGAGGEQWWGRRGTVVGQERNSGGAGEEQRWGRRGTVVGQRDVQLVVIDHAAVVCRQTWC